MTNCSPWRLRTRGGTDDQKIFNEHGGRPPQQHRVTERFRGGRNQQALRVLWKR